MKQQLSKEAKEAIVLKAINRGEKPLRLIAQAHNIGLSSLNKWLQHYRASGAASSEPKEAGPVQRLSSAEKFEHVLATHTLSAVSLGKYCRGHGLYSHQITEWKKTFMKQDSQKKQSEQAGALKKLKAENQRLQRELTRKEKALAEASALLVMKKKSELNLGGKRGRCVTREARLEAMALVQEACVHGAGKRKACALLQVSLRTLERWEKSSGAEDKRKTSKRLKQVNQLSEEEREMIITVANSAPYKDLPPSKIVPLLADEGRYIASESTFYRVLRAQKQLTHRGHCKPSRHRKPSAHVAESPNKVWSWDISFLPTTVRGLYFYLYLILDIYSRKIVGWHIHDRESSELASGLIEQACEDEEIDKAQITLHSDNGKPMKGALMLATLERLGVLPSFSRPSVSDDNPYSESLFRTVKYHPTFPIETRFADINAARDWMEGFTNWYNNEHLHSGLKFVTPNQRHRGEDTAIFSTRTRVYQLAKEQHPERWSGKIRDWSLPTTVTLNPDRKGKNDHDTQIEEVIMAA